MYKSNFIKECILFAGALKANQQETVDSIISSLQENYSTIVALPCGYIG